MKKITSIALSIVILITMITGVQTTVFAASKPPSTQIVSVKGGENKINVKWKKKAVTGYQIQYSTTKKFTAKKTKTVTIKKKATVSKTIKGLKPSKKYYVRVRTYKSSDGKKKYSKWSKVKAAFTKKGIALYKYGAAVPDFGAAFGIKAEDYEYEDGVFCYEYSIENLAAVADENFESDYAKLLNQNGYKHITYDYLEDGLPYSLYANSDDNWVMIAADEDDIYIMYQ